MRRPARQEVCVKVVCHPWATVGFFAPPGKTFLYHGFADETIHQILDNLGKDSFCGFCPSSRDDGIVTPQVRQDSRITALPQAGTIQNRACYLLHVHPATAQELLQRPEQALRRFQVMPNAHRLVRGWK